MNGGLDEEDWLVPLREMDEIVPGLWMGSVVKDHVPMHIGAVVNCCGCRPSGGVPAGCIYVEAAFEDRVDRVPDEKWLVALADTVNVLRRAVGNVLVHCTAGLNRSGLVTALALMRGDGMAAHDAVRLIRRKRDRSCLCNPAFVSFLVRHVPPFMELR